jgi:cytochrome P450
VPVIDLDLTDAAFIADPYPALARLRATAPMVWHQRSDMWLATTHAAVSEVLRNRALGRVWRDREPADVYEPFNALHRHQMMENEPPTHTRLRRLVAAAFTRGHVDRLQPRVVDIAGKLLDGVDPGGVERDGVDILAAYAEPLPVAVIAELLGAPAEDRSLLRAWSRAIVAMYEYDRGPGVGSAAVVASREFGDYVRDVVRDRRSRPRPDLISDLIAVRDRGGPLSEDELVASVVLLLNAGHEASVNVFGNGLVALLQHPREHRRVVGGRAGWDTTVEELIRYDAPLQLFERTATRDVDVAGTRVRTGQQVAALMGSANRDPSVFGDADELDVARDPNPHVGFGMGLHFCLGAPLARMELRVALRVLLDRYPRLALLRPPEPPTRFVLKGYDRVVVQLGRPAGREGRT